MNYCVNALTTWQPLGSQPLREQHQASNISVPVHWSRSGQDYLEPAPKSHGITSAFIHLGGTGRCRV